MEGSIVKIAENEGVQERQGDQSTGETKVPATTEEKPAVTQACTTLQKALVSHCLDHVKG